ncbi:MAG: phospholipid/cholesterol/gamma-HCH transport system substrate-binding protein [Saprospiraceae bacterium]|jgi:phospholipid/cholesterol/gamma-HCH transport system substrate-binding protein
MSRETRIGILVAVALAVFVLGFKYLKGQNVLSSDYLFYAEYSNVDQLLPSNPVLKNGLEIGKVRDVYMKADDPSKIIVEMSVNGNLNIPKNAKAIIISTSVMGGKAILLEYNTVCSGADCAQSNDYLNSESKGFISSLIGDPSDAKAYVDVMKDGVTSLVDSLSESVDSTSEVGKTFASLQATLNNLEKTTARLDRLMANSTGSLEKTLRSVESLTSNLASNNAKITGILANVDAMTASLNKADMGKTVGIANSTLEEMQKVMKSANEAVVKLSSVMDKANSQDGSLGKLLNDKELYENLNQVSKSITLMTSDIRVNPQRYRRILSKKTKTAPINEIPEEVKD